MMGGVRAFPILSTLLVSGLLCVTSVRGGTDAKPATAGLEVALRDAHALAGRHPGSRVVRVSGDSMVPFFSDGAVLVVRPVSGNSIRVGVIAAYVNRFGETVVHRVTRATPDGWQVRGYNNRHADSTTVNGTNLIGAVYAVFDPHSSDPVKDPVQLAQLMALTPLALAAPAR